MADLLLTLPPPLGFRFGVLFLAGGVLPQPLDCRFASVSGLSTQISTETVNSGGQNLYSYELPKRAQHSNLVLKRGLARFSPVALEFNVAMSTLRFAPSNVLITLMEDKPYIPVMAWMFTNAYPVQWSVADLDADKCEVVIETLELVYQRVQTIRI